MSWEVLSDPGVVHVLPLSDSVGHQDTEDECDCGPYVEFVGSGKIVVHHSLDGRERFE